jgi:putative sugar O-methyltransferase
MAINLQHAFATRLPTDRLPQEEISKIMQFYRRWHESQKSLSSQYQVSREWLPIYQNYMGETINAMLQDDQCFVTDAFENFFRRPLSTGLHGVDFKMVERFMTPTRAPSNEDLTIFQKNCELCLYNFVKSCPNTSIDKLQRKPVGNPYGYQVGDIFVYPSAEFHYYCAKNIKMLLANKKNPTVLELGGGYGGLAFYLSREIPQAKIILLDLPENAALQAFYLKSQHPEKKIILYGEAPLDSHYDILIAPNFAIDELQENSIDLTFNSYSLAETSIETINFHVEKICKITSRFFYHLNHVYWEVSADDFPIDHAKFKLIFRNPTIWNKDFRDYKIDQHEYLYCADVK